MLLDTNTQSGCKMLSKGASSRSKIHHFFQLRWHLMMTCLSCSDSQPMFRAASVEGVTYSITDTQSSHRCPCKQVQHRIRGTHFTTYVSYSAVNISVIAKNAVGFSPTAVTSVGHIETVDLKSECTRVHACSSGIVCTYPAGCTFGHFQLLLLFFLTSL